MALRFVIPQGADPDDVAWDHRPETWQELANQTGDEVIIENMGSVWCLENGITGLGFFSDVNQF